MNMHRCLRYILLMLACCVGIPFTTSAEDADFEHEVYQRTSDLLHSHTYDQGNLAIADSIYAASKSHGSLFGMLCAQRLRMYVHVAARDSAKLISSTEEALTLAEKLHDVDAYTETMNVKISFYIGQEHYLKAKQLVEEMLAKSADTPVMLYQSYSLMGTIYQNRDMHDVAIKYYNKALNYVEETDSINRCIIYRNLAECHSLLEKGEIALDYAKKALEMAGTEGVYYYWSAFTYLHTLFQTKEYDTFLAEYDRIKLLDQHVEGLLPTYVQNQLLLRYEILHDNFDKALKLANDIEYKSLRLPAIILVYRMSGNWQKVVEYYDLYNTYEDSVRTQMTMDDMLEMDSQIELNHLKIEKKDLEARNQRTTLSSIIAIILVCLAALTYMLIRRRAHIRELNAKNQELSEKNQQLYNKNEELVEARDEAERASLMKTRFMQNISHEIRTPLHAISGFSQIIAEDISDEERQQYAQIIVENVEAASTMLSDMLLLSDLDKATHNIQCTDIPAIEAQRKILLSAPEIIPEHIAFVCPIELDERICLHADPALLHTILLKLLHNAAKFTSSGNITLTCTLTADQRIQYSVTDTGCGIPSEWSERIFERFVKVDEFIPGVGIGLTICKEAVQLMGGTIRLDTNHTCGSRFVIEFPQANS